MTIARLFLARDGWTILSIMVIIGLFFAVLTVKSCDKKQEAIMCSTTPWKEFVETMSACLTPVIGIATVYIAYQQYKTNELNLRHELYDRRLRVFKAVQAYIADVVNEGSVTHDKTIKMNIETAEAVFIFNNEVKQFINILYKKGIDLRTLQLKLFNSDGTPRAIDIAERTRLIEQERESLEWFSGQLEKSEQLFCKHMGIKK